MVVLLQDGEVLESVLDVSCRLGRGSMYVTSRQIMVELGGGRGGLVFVRSHEQMADVQARKNAEIRLLWPENDKRCDAVFVVAAMHARQPDGSFDSARVGGGGGLTAARIVDHWRRDHDYRDNYPALLGGGGKAGVYGGQHVEMGQDMRRHVIRERIRRMRGRIDVLESRLESERKRQMHMKRDLVSAALVCNHMRREIKWRRLYIDDIRDAKFVISRRIARHPAIPVHMIESNDCWRDMSPEGGGSYLTLSSIWHASDYHTEAPPDWVAAKYGPVLARDITVVPPDNVVYVHGYPAEMRQNPAAGDTLMYAFLPTMTDEMLIDRIISRTYGLSIHDLDAGGVQLAGHTVVEPEQPDCTYDTPMSRRLDSERMFLGSASYNEEYGGDYLVEILAGVEVPERDEQRFVKWCAANDIEYLPDA